MKLQGTMLVVRDLALSRRFYEELLGLRVVVDFGANITFDAGFSLQSLESWLGFIDKEPAAVRFQGNDFELYFEAEDFPAFLERLEANPVAKLVHPVKTQDWGQRTARFYSPDGHVIEVAEAMDDVIARFLSQGLSAEETSRRTMYPLEVVEAIQKGVG